MAGHGSPRPEDKALHPGRSVSQLKGDVTRSGNRVQKIEDEYGARDIPKTSPLHAKVTAARAKHHEALTAYVKATPR
jgi:hypothetical protein